MIPRRIAGATRNLGAPKNWNEVTDAPCGHLPIRDTQHEGANWMVSRWEPSAEELAQLAAGGSVELWIAGINHPVISLGVAPLDTTDP